MWWNFFGSDCCNIISVVQIVSRLDLQVDDPGSDIYVAETSDMVIVFFCFLFFTFSKIGSKISDELYDILFWI